MGTPDGGARRSLQGSDPRGGAAVVLGRTGPGNRSRLQETGPQDGGGHTVTSCNTARMDSALALAFVRNKRSGTGVVFLRAREQEGRLGVEGDPGLLIILFHNRTEEAAEVPQEMPGSQDVERELVLRRWTWGRREGPGRLGPLDSTSPMTHVGPERRGDRLGTTEQPGKSSSSEEGDPEPSGARGGTRPQGASMSPRPQTLAPESSETHH